MPDGLLGKRKKNFKTNWKTNKCFLFMIIGYGLVLEAYFVFNYYQNKQLMTNLQSLKMEINATSAAGSFFYFTANTQTMMFLNYSQQVLNKGF
jgi:predicted negative regulator of RcsB-dependent stress response